MNLFFITAIILVSLLYLAKKRDIYRSRFEVEFPIFKMKIVNKQLSSDKTNY